jgi:cell division protein FtsW
MYVPVGSTPVQDAPEAEDDEAGGNAGRPAGVGAVLGGLGGVGERVRAARALLDRPLTSYYLIAGITTLLLCLGLVMVLSTASVADLTQGESPYHDFKVQLIGIVVGVPIMWAAARCQPRLFRAAAYPLLAVSAIGLFLILIPGVGTSVNGATRWIAVGPLTVEPSEIAKLALAVWGADLLARKEKLGMLADWRHMLMPLLPGTGVLALLVMSGHDLGTTSILLIIFLALLWYIGTPGRVFVGLLIFMLLVLLLLVVTESYRLKRLTGFWDTTGANSSSVNWQATQGKSRLGPAGSSGWGSARAGRSGAGFPSPRATSSSRSSARSSAWSAPCASRRCTGGSPSPGCGWRGARPTRSAGCSPGPSRSGSSARRW